MGRDMVDFQKLTADAAARRYEAIKINQDKWPKSIDDPAKLPPIHMDGPSAFLGAQQIELPPPTPAAKPFRFESAEPPISAEQQAAIDVLESGQNVFLTGNAGTGKSHTINRWLATTAKNVARTASTGIAATHISGQTVHSWAGIGIGDKPIERFIYANWWQNKIATVIRRTDAIIIDEISMFPARMLDMLDEVCRFARDDKEKPFGGLQVVFVGDMGQLPPVDGKFCFLAESWMAARIRIIELQKVFRQTNESFARLLRQVRDGRVSDAGYKALLERIRAFDPDAAPQAPRLMTHNAQVDIVNARRLSALPGDLVSFSAKDDGPQKGLEKLARDCPAPSVLRLKVGARVMFLKNALPNYANGTIGTVIELTPAPPEKASDDDPFDFDEKGVAASPAQPEATISAAIKVRTDSGAEIAVPLAEWEIECGSEVVEMPGGVEKTIKKKACRRQYPLRLAWAISIHRSQGSTFDRASVRIDRSFADGQVYVALSRVKSYQGLNIEEKFDRHKISVHADVKKFFAQIEKEKANGV